MPGPLAPLLGGLAATAFWAGLRTVLMGIVRQAAAAAPRFIAHALAAFGIYMLVVEPVSDIALDWVIQRFSGAPGTVLETLYYLNVDNYVSAIVSAYGARTAGDIMFKAKVTGANP